MIIKRSRLTGYCHGVLSTLNQASKCLNRAEQLNLPCYSIGTLIHNTDVVTYFEQQGLKVITQPEDNPGIALIRAHGISNALRSQFEEKGFILEDSTCNNIIKTKYGMKRAFENQRTVVLLGNAKHAEVRGLEDSVEKLTVISTEEEARQFCKTEGSETPVSVFTQTTFESGLYKDIVSILEDYFTDFEIGSKLCQACTARRKIAQELATTCDAVVVVGCRHSNNTTDLLNVINQAGGKGWLVENAQSITPEVAQALKGLKTVGICSGTSTPTIIVDEVQRYLEAL